MSHEFAFWSVPREWPGETVFIVGGGPSVLGLELEALRGRRVIAINSSVYKLPWADILYFGDWRWWNEPHNRAAVASFRGRVVTTSRMVSEDKKVLVCRAAKPPGLAQQHDSLMQKWTSLTAATNLSACRRRPQPSSPAAPLAAPGRLLRQAARGPSHHRAVAAGAQDSGVQCLAGDGMGRPASGYQPAGRAG